MTIAYIGLGANLGDRRANLDKALKLLGDTAGVTVVTVSGFRETEPVGGPSQPDYLNAVARVETELPANALLEVLLKTEKAAGREKTGVRWGPRHADLDLLLYGDEVIETPDLVVPHPRLREREFVLEPLAEIAPDVRDPVTGRTARELLRDLRQRTGGQKTCRVVRTIEELESYVAMAERNRFTIGLVPTMGAFHEGHLSLMRGARARVDKVVVSIFVNPSQFGPEEDLDRYPRQLEQDVDLAAAVGVDLVFAPSVEEMYPPGGGTWVTVEGVSDTLCGEARPGHFRGVATVVLSLFNLVRPDEAFFGRKDYQQSVVIRRMVRDLHVPVEVVIAPTVREADGLAMSSRNAYLSPEERERATCLWRGMAAARQAFDAGERVSETLVARTRDVLEATEGAVPEYVAIVDPDTLEPVPVIRGPAYLLLAVKVGDTRLIDNMPLGEEE